MRLEFRPVVRSLVLVFPAGVALTCFLWHGTRGTDVSVLRSSGIVCSTSSRDSIESLNAASLSVGEPDGQEFEHPESILRHNADALDFHREELYGVICRFRDDLSAPFAWTVDDLLDMSRSLTPPTEPLVAVLRNHARLCPDYYLRVVLDLFLESFDERALAVLVMLLGEVASEDAHAFLLSMIRDGGSDRLCEAAIAALCCQGDTRWVSADAHPKPDGNEKEQWFAIWVDHRSRWHELPSVVRSAIADRLKPGVADCVVGGVLVSLQEIDSCEELLDLLLPLHAHVTSQSLRDALHSLAVERWRRRR